MRMHITNSLLPALLFSAMGGSALAMPSPEDTANPSQKAATAITTSQIISIAPESKSCSNAVGDYKDECATAETAARAITASFERYDVTSPAEQAAIIGLMAFESGEFLYNRNHFPQPGVLGQGTRNMQSPEYNIKYAQSIPEISNGVCKGMGDLGHIMDLLLANEEYDFGSGAWFLTTQCKEDVREGLQRGGTEEEKKEEWEAYIVGCVGTGANAERWEYWQRAVKALGVS